MTNEEKALKVSRLKERPDDEERYYNSFGCKIYDIALEIAEWKDKEFAEEKKQWLEKACEWLDNWFTDDIGQCRIPITKFARNEFFKYFKQAMEEQL